MFKILRGRSDPAGFDDPVIIVNLSQFWLSVSDDGDQVPPAGVAAIDSATAASSSKISELVADKLLEVLGERPEQSDKPKKRKKAEAAAEAPPPSQSEEPKLATVINFPKIGDDQLVADPPDEKQVLLENNIDNPE